MTILGLHHITLLCADGQRTIDFYTRVLGLRLVKKTVNFDDPGVYHLYFGDETGSPGSVITFFEWPRAKKGWAGIGGTHHFSLQVGSETGLLRWKRRLEDNHVAVRGPFDHTYFQSITFPDPDGALLEIATTTPGWNVDEPPSTLGSEVARLPGARLSYQPEQPPSESWPEPVPEITAEMSLSRGMHHITAISSDLARTHDFYAGLLGLRRIKMTASLDDPQEGLWVWGDENGRPGTAVAYFEEDPHSARAARYGAGQAHHFALAVADDVSQLEWRDNLLAAGLQVTPVLDRKYFKSIYLNDPDGHIVELATAGPGFLIDEDPHELGQRLMLPAWLESRRPAIEEALRPLVTPAWQPLVGG